MIGWSPAIRAAETPAGLPPLAPSAVPSAARAARELPLLLVAAGVIAFLLKTFVAQAFYIPSGSMLPQLQINDRVVVSKLAYKLHEPNRGDIVVFDAPPGAAVATPKGELSPVLRALRYVGERIGVVQPSTDEFIKRVLALPGETVEGRGGRVWVDGNPVHEPYLPAGVTTSDFPATKVPPGTLWVMGDNRGNSSDSRFFGPIRQDTVVGRTIARVWPIPSASFL